jgi:hypothetical protein
MGKPIRSILLLAAAAFPHTLPGQYMRGKVAIPDGATLRDRPIIERICPGLGPVQVAAGNKRGEFIWRMEEGIVDGLGMFHYHSPVVCYLRARITGYESNLLNLSDPRVFRTSQFPPMILRRASAAAAQAAARLPAGAARSWALAMKAMNGQQWADGERGCAR